MKHMLRILLMTLAVVFLLPAPVVFAKTNIDSVDSTDTAIQQPPIDDKNSSVSTPPGDNKEETKVADESSDEGLPVPDTINPPKSSDVKEGTDLPSQSADSSSTQAVTKPETPSTTNENDKSKLGLVISKISTIDKYIEIYNPNDAAVDLRGWSLEYRTKSGTKTVARRFDKNLAIAPKGFILLASDKTLPLAMLFDSKPGLSRTAGSVVLIHPDGSSSDVIGWGDAKYFESEAAAGGAKLFWRCFNGDLVVDSDINKLDIMSSLKDDDLQTIKPGTRPSCTDLADEDDKNSEPINRCKGLKLNEIIANSDDQIIELINSSDSDLDVSGCSIRTSHSRESIELGGAILKRGDLLKVKIASGGIKLPKTVGGTIYLMDPENKEIDFVRYDQMNSGQSWSFVDGKWQKTYQPTPGSDNISKENPSCQIGYFYNQSTGRCNKRPEEKSPLICPSGSYLNPASGRCKKHEPVKAAALTRFSSGTKVSTPCRKGYYRDLSTGRCRKIAAAAASKLKPCAPGQARNPLTGKCKKIASSSNKIKKCKDGYERNPKTNRCRKIVRDVVPAAAFAPSQVKQVAGATWGWWVFGGASLLAASYGIWQWRWELSQLLKRVFAPFNSHSK